MGKFCSDCGKPLDGKKTCDCKSKNSSSKSDNNMKGYIDLFLGIVKGIFIKPVDTIKKYADERNSTFGWIVILINSLISGLFIFCLIKEGTNSATSLLPISLLGFGSIGIPFFKIFLIGTLFMLVDFIVTAAMILLMSIIFKANVNFKKIISLISVCSIFTLLTTTASIIFVFISIKLTLFIILIAGFFYLTHLYQGIAEISDADKNKLAYIFIPSILVTTFIVVYILPRILF